MFAPAPNAFEEEDHALRRRGQERVRQRLDVRGNLGVIHFRPRQPGLKCSIAERVVGHDRLVRNAERCKQDRGDDPRTVPAGCAVEDDSMVALRNGPQAPGDRIAARNGDAQVHLALRWIGATDFERSEGQRFLFEQRHVVIVRLTKVAGSPFALELPGRAQVDDRTDAKALKHSKIRRGQPQRARAEDATPSDRSPISR